MARPRTVRPATLLVLSCAGALGLVWRLAESSGSGVAAAEAQSVESIAAAREPPLAGPPGDLAREEAPRGGPVARAGDLDDPNSPAGGGKPQRAADRTTEREFYERFFQTANQRPAELEAMAEGILRGTGPDPEKVALLRALDDCGSPRAGELHLLALRELPGVSDPQGESVPSTVLGLLDRRAQRDARARDVLRRAAFELPRPPPSSRQRAAASFFLHATQDELRAARDELAREADPRFLDAALEALGRNSNTDLAAMLLAQHGRAPAPNGGSTQAGPNQGGKR